MRYLLKCDIDVFVNVPHLVVVLQKCKSSLRNILGYLTSNVAYIVYRDGQYSVTMEEYPLGRYRQYAAGPSYVISNDLSLELFETSEYVPFFRMEDIYVTSILPVIIGGISLVVLPGVTTMGFSGKHLTGWVNGHMTPWTNDPPDISPPDLSPPGISPREIW